MKMKHLLGTVVEDDKSCNEKTNGECNNEVVIDVSTLKNVFHRSEGGLDNNGFVDRRLSMDVLTR